MKIGLADYEFVNGDIEHNISQIEKGLKAAQGRADLLCFGETFLQGFDSLNWQYENDRYIAVAAGSETMRRLGRLAGQHHTDLLVGYIESYEDAIYSSCAVFEAGELTYNYRRISKGWKEYSITDGHYREGTETDGFTYRGRRVKLALCGDLWDFPERFRTDGLLIWPVYVNFTREEWAGYEPEYAGQAALAASKTLMVNSISRSPDSCGGAFCFTDGRTESKLELYKEDILIVEV